MMIEFGEGFGTKCPEVLPIPNRLVVIAPLKGGCHEEKYYDYQYGS